MQWRRTVRLLALALPAFLLCHAIAQDPQQAVGPVSPNDARASREPILRVGGGVSPPRLLTDPEPEYSELARKLGHQGVCVLWLVVGSDGKPRDIKVARVLGLGLDDQAIAAVRKWTFQPALKDGKPVAVQINVEVNYHLDGVHGKYPKLWERARDGDVKAQYELATAMLEGHGLPKSEGDGIQLLTQSANQGFLRAQHLLAQHLYENPRGGTPDYVNAYKWFALAQRGGEKHCDEPLKEITAKMTPEQLAEAQARVDAWKPTTAK